jgi:hypothetical protein
MLHVDTKTGRRWDICAVWGVDEYSRRQYTEAGGGVNTAREIPRNGEYTFVFGLQVLLDFVRDFRAASADDDWDG